MIMPNLLKKGIEIKPEVQTKLSKKEKKALEEQEAARVAKEKLDAERQELLQLSEKELLVEIIFALRGYEERIKELEKTVGSAEKSAKVAAMNAAIANLK